jgi:parallel beta-helix repeat protein
MKRQTSIMILVLFLLVPPVARGTVLTSDTVWSGEVSVTEDVLVPAGVKLTITPGTVIRVAPAEMTKTDPEYLSSMTEITVRGALITEGNDESPVVFRGTGHDITWAGIIVDGGKADLNGTLIRDAETGVNVLQGSVLLRKTRLSNNRYGLVVNGGDADITMKSSEIKDNDYGLMLLNEAGIKEKDTIIAKNRKKDRYVATANGYRPSLKGFKAGQKELSRLYNDAGLPGTTIWQGRIVVKGIVRVPPDARLIILPGTIVEFTKRDTNDDGIGENGLLIQGMFIAKGTPQKPIFFRSGENRREMGDWDAINIMNSDRFQNIIEHCQIEDAYRGVHFHFSNVIVSDSVFRNNYRGLQFQESIVEIRNSRIFGNKNAIRARDSEIIFRNNTVSRNYSGMNVFRNTITLKDNAIVNNAGEGLRVREGVPVLERNLLDGNRHGLMVTDAFYGTFSRNVISHNLESGIALRSTDNVEINGNVIQNNGINGITIQDSRALIRRNLISENGERGIGVISFLGNITDNNILRNGLYNLGIDGTMDVKATNNWWGGEDMSSTIYDKEDDPEKGKAAYVPVLEEPVLVSWPADRVWSDTGWHGALKIEGDITVSAGAKLTVSPGTRVLFSKGAGLKVEGKIIAQGEEHAKIRFASVDGDGPEQWGEIHLDHATGSIFSHCVIQNATWALHVHFTDLTVDNCSIRQNKGGMRFTSGPMQIKNSLFTKNDIGIRAFRGNAIFSDNVITKNRIGIFVREKGSGLTITKNNLFGNADYNIRVGDFNNEDVDARNNWWGNIDPKDMIFDERREPEIGYVRYEPFAKKPFSLNTPKESRDAGGANR